MCYGCLIPAHGRMCVVCELTLGVSQFLSTLLFETEFLTEPNLSS